MSPEIFLDGAPDVVARALAGAKAHGASAADALLIESESFFVQVRLRALDKLKGAQERRLGLRVLFGSRSATASTSDLSPAALDRFVEETCTLARTTGEDPWAGLPEPGELAGAVPDLDLWDPGVGDLAVEERIERARRAEEAALGADPRIGNSEGAEWEDVRARVTYGNSHGFVGQYRGTSASLSVTPVARQDGQMQRDAWYTTGRRLATLEVPEAVGKRAADRVLRRLGARKIPTQQAPVVFDPETAASLLRSLASAASGHSIYRGSSFLVGRLGTRIAPAHVTVLDDGTRPQGLGSKPFDGEGVPTRQTAVIEKGILLSFLLDTYSARKLRLRSTGNAARSPEDAPAAAPTNFFLVPGDTPPDSIVRSVRSGLYVTELIGFGINPVTGDYSRGAAGLWIDQGELAYPVEEITIAGNLLEMLAAVEAVGSDLEFRGRIAAPTLLIGRMTIAGH